MTLQKGFEMLADPNLGTASGGHMFHRESRRADCGDFHATHRTKPRRWSRFRYTAASGGLKERRPPLPGRGCLRIRESTLGADR
jgi:hypothetical protein